MSISWKDMSKQKRLESYQRYCKLRGELTDYRVACMTGIGGSAFTNWKHGTSMPKYDRMLRIAEALGVGVTDIVG